MAVKKLETEKKPDQASYWDEIPDEAQMSFFDHLEELRQRLFAIIIAAIVGIIICFHSLDSHVPILICKSKYF